MSFIYVSQLLSVPPRAHDKSEVGGTCPSVPHGVGAYDLHQFIFYTVFQKNPEYFQSRFITTWQRLKVLVLNN